MREDFFGGPVDILSSYQTLDDKLSVGSRQRCQQVASNVAKYVKIRRQSELWRDVVESDIAGILCTRSEAIKLCPDIYGLREYASPRISALSTGQDRATLDRVHAVTDIRSNVDLNVMLVMN